MEISFEGIVLTRNMLTRHMSPTSLNVVARNALASSTVSVHLSHVVVARAGLESAAGDGVRAGVGTMTTREWDGNELAWWHEGREQVKDGLAAEGKLTR